MKCEVLLLNRGRAKGYKKGHYEALTGECKLGFLRPSYKFYIPDNARPIELEYSKRRVSATIPLWLVNEKTGVALSYTQRIVTKTEDTPEDKLAKEQGLTVKHELIDIIEIEEVSDADIHTKLNLLTKKEFWEMVAERLKLGLIMTLIYMGSGYGFFRFAEYLFTIMINRGK
jgi:hypothetical protein